MAEKITIDMQLSAMRERIAREEYVLTAVKAAPASPVASRRIEAVAEIEARLAALRKTESILSICA